MPQHWIGRAGNWLTKRRTVAFAAFFTVVVLTAHAASSQAVELGRNLAGALCLVAGAWLRRSAVRYHDSAHQRQPITAGPYAWIRHPLYAGNFLMGFGVIWLAGWWPMAFAYVVLFLGFHVPIALAEERHLGQQYGARYEAYRQAVPAIVPRRPFPEPRYGRPGRVKLRGGRESAKTALCALGIGGLLLIKWWRATGAWPSVPPIPASLVALSTAAILWAIIVRPRASWMRAGHTVLAIAGGVMLAVAIRHF